MVASISAQPTHFAVEKQHSRAKRFWNLYAKVYGSVENLVPYKEMLQSVVDLVPMEATSILDVGCGAGSLLTALRRERPQTRLTGIDFSGEMLAKAKARVGGIEVHQADLNKGLPFSDAQFDCIVSTNVLYAVKAPKSLVSELLRVIKPQGRVIICSPKRQAKGTAILLHHLRRVAPLQGLIDLAKFSTCILPNLIIERRARKQSYHFFSREEIEQLGGEVTIHNDTFAGQNWLFSLRNSSVTR